MTLRRVVREPAHLAGRRVDGLVAPAAGPAAVASGMPAGAVPLAAVGDQPLPTGGRQRVAALAQLAARPAAGTARRAAGAAGRDPEPIAPATSPAAVAPMIAAPVTVPDPESEPSDPGDELGRAQNDPGWARRLTESGPWDSLADRWVPEPLRGARVNPGRRGAVLITAVALVAAVVAAIGVWSTRPKPTAVDAATLPAAAAVAGLDRAEPDSLAADPPAGPSAATAAAAPSEADVPAPHPTTSATPASGPMMVSVTGDVRHPGLVTVPAGARVADAIAAAGGVADSASLTGLNLAARLVDGASVVVGGPGGNAIVTDTGQPSTGAGAGVGAGSGGSAAVVHLNSADAAALETLPGVGPVTAQAILSYRTEHGPFTDVAQLQEVSGIGPATFAKLAPHVAL